MAANLAPLPEGLLLDILSHFASCSERNRNAPSQAQHNGQFIALDFSIHLLPFSRTHTLLRMT